MKVSTAGDQLRPSIETSEISRITSGFIKGLLITPGVTTENSGTKVTPNTAATMLWTCGITFEQLLAAARATNTSNSSGAPGTPGTPGMPEGRQR